MNKSSRVRSDYRHSGQSSKARQSERASTSKRKSTSHGKRNMDENVKKSEKGDTDAIAVARNPVSDFGTTQHELDFAEKGIRENWHLDIEMQKGFFEQDVAKGKLNQSLGTVYRPQPNFGLKHGSWQEFSTTLDQLNKNAPKDAHYVLLYLGRHGQGFHNIAEEKVGTYFWENAEPGFSDEPMCFLPEFIDAHLTPVGEDQAETNSQYFRDLIENKGLPVPDLFYTSPLHRAISTMLKTWVPLAKRDMLNKFEPQVHELLREQMYNHICNRRSSYSKIENDFRQYKIHCNDRNTCGYAARDPITHQNNDDYTWSRDYREQDPQVEDRAYVVLRSMLAPYLDKPTSASSTSPKFPRIISITCHAGIMSGIYRLLGYEHTDVPRFPTGIVVPLLLKITKKPGPRPINSDHWHWYQRRELGTRREDDRNLKKNVAGIEDYNIGLHGTPRKDLGGKTRDEILKEIFDLEHYKKVKNETKEGKWT